MEFQTEDAVHLLVHSHTFDDFFLHLVLGHENVSIVLGEATYTEEAMEGAFQFVAVYQAEFADAHGEISVRTLLGLVVQDSAGAVHRFDCIVFFIDLGEVHIFFVVIPMAGLEPQFLGQNHRGHDFYIAEFFEEFSFVFHQLVAQVHALRVEEREARTFFMEGEEIQRFSASARTKRKCSRSSLL